MGRNQSCNVAKLSSDIPLSLSLSLFLLSYKIVIYSKSQNGVHPLDLIYLHTRRPAAPSHFSTPIFVRRIMYKFLSGLSNILAPHSQS